MSSVGTDKRPDTVYLVEWKDIFGVDRKALSLQKRDVESMQSVDPDARIVEGKVEWTL